MTKVKKYGGGYKKKKKQKEQKEKKTATKKKSLKFSNRRDNGQRKINGQNDGKEEKIKKHIENCDLYFKIQYDHCLYIYKVPFWIGSVKRFVRDCVHRQTDRHTDTDTQSHTLTHTHILSDTHAYNL